MNRVRIDPLFDGVSTGPLVSTFVAASANRDVPGNTPADWKGIARDGEMVVLPLGGFLVRDGRRTVLIDAGFGHRGSTPSSLDFAGGALQASLESLGVSPEEVTDVLLTHLHYDHIGWCATDGAPTFPHARYRCHVDDWVAFVGPEAKDATTREQLRSLEAAFELWDADHEPFESFALTHAPGHTPGSSIVTVTAGDDRILFLGDLVHHPVQLERERWASLGDIDPERAEQTRHRVRSLLRDTGAYAAPAHFAGMRPGRLLPERWQALQPDDASAFAFGDFDLVERRSAQLAAELTSESPTTRGTL